MVPFWGKVLNFQVTLHGLVFCILDNMYDIL